MKEIFVLWHLGLGDQIICNGLIRSLSNDNTTFLLPVKHHNVSNITDMFKDLQNIKIIPVIDDSDMHRCYNLSSKYIDDVLKIGIFGKNFMLDCKTFDESFYKQANVSYSLRWDNFKYVIYKESQIKINYDEDFIFVHDDFNRGLNIKNKYLNNFKIYRPQHSLGIQTNYTIFNYISILERAKEIHCMDSSFACMIEHMPSLKYKKKFIHRYIRKTLNNPHYLNNWHTIND